VNNTLCGSGINALDRETGLLGNVGAAFIGGSDGPLGACLQLGTNRLVAKASFLILSIALDLALDVGHGGPLS